MVIKEEWTMPQISNDLTFLLDKKPDEILEHFRNLGVALDKDWYQYMKMFDNQAFFIAHVHKANLLILAKKIIEQAIESGTDLKEFTSKIKDELKLKDWHAKIIITQNINNAFNEGRLKLQMDTKASFPYMLPVVTMDTKTTDNCYWLESENICFKTDDPNLYKMYPPRHFRCRTIFVSLTEKKKDNLKLKVRPIDTIPENRLNDIDFRRKPLSVLQPNISKFPTYLKNKLKKIIKTK